jgi:HPr kinase/phosphorylase
LFEENREKLRLEWVGGRDGAVRELNSELTKDSSQGLIGHLNFIHPNLIQVVGSSEAAYLCALDPTSCRAVLSQVATKELACFLAAAVDEFRRRSSTSPSPRRPRCSALRSRASS